MYVCAQSLSHVQLFVIQWTVATRLLCPWDSPGKNIGVGCHFLLQGIFPTQESNLGLLHFRQILHRLSYEGSPHLTRVTSPIPYQIYWRERSLLFLLFLTLFFFHMYPSQHLSLPENQDSSMVSTFDLHSLAFCCLLPETRNLSES